MDLSEKDMRLQVISYRISISIIALPLLVFVFTAGLPVLLAIYWLRKIAAFDQRKYAELIDG